MYNFKGKILDIVKSSPRRLCLPEGQDIRVLKAAEMIVKEKFTSELFVLGNPGALTTLARQNGIDLTGVNLLDPVTASGLNNAAAALYESRKSKGMTEEEALKTMKDEVYYGCHMLAAGEVDAVVSGSLTPTAKTVRASLLVVKPKPGIKTVSGSFVMIVPDCPFGVDGAFIYADCGVVPEPTSDQLADIAIASADTCRKLLGAEPVVSFLSFSTLGSAEAPSVAKVRDAVNILRGRNPDFIFDGEMQFDAAVEPSVGRMKAPNSNVAGKANVCVFPDLSAGNIAYKITQRLAKAEAYGPLLQGLSRPVNDLSRGATPEDILVVSAITVAQSL